MERLFDLSTRKFYHIGRDGQRKACLNPIKGHDASGQSRVGLIADPMSKQTFQLDREDMVETERVSREISVWEDKVFEIATRYFSFDCFTWSAVSRIQVVPTQEELVVLEVARKERQVKAEERAAFKIQEALLAQTIKITGRIASIMSKPGYRWALIQHIIDTRKVSHEVANLFVAEHAQKALLKWQEDKVAKAALYRK